MIKQNLVKTLLTITAFCIVSLNLMIGAQNWSAAKSNLVTDWGQNVDPNEVHNNYPRPQLRRKNWKNINGLWDLKIGKAGDKELSELKYEHKILVPFPVESGLSGVKERGEYFIYKNEFTIPEDWNNKRIILHFGAVDWETEVYVNNNKVGSHKGGYDSFSFDITNIIKKDEKQEIIVTVYDPSNDGAQPVGKQVKSPHGIYYTPNSGIWQTVWLEPVNKKYINDLKITPNIDNRNVKVEVVSNSNNQLYANINILADNNLITQKKVKINTQNNIEIDKPHLWSLNDPFLYDLEVELLKSNEVVDKVQSYFGMRKIEVKKDENGINRIYLNDKYEYQMGVLDQGYWPDGIYTAPTDNALKYDIEIAKELGFNVIRKHVKIEPQRWYYWCDKIGMLVWQDMPSVNSRSFNELATKSSKKQFEHELKQMITELYNHPSIIMWVLFNEGWGQYDTKRLTDSLSNWDSSRIINSVSGWHDRNVGDIIDMHSYPGPDSPDPEPDRAAILGEFGGLGLPIKNHLWVKDNWGYQNLTSVDELQDRYEILLNDMWKLEKYPGLSGAIYTQITDVETETNGLLTYDRKVVKMNKNVIASYNNDEMVSPPDIVPQKSIFIDNIRITLKNRKGEPIYYTLNGDTPDRKSKKYTKPINIRESSTLKAISIEQNNKSSVVVGEFEKTELMKPIDNLKNLKPGLKYDYFRGTWERLPDFDTLEVKDQGIAKNVDLEPAKHNDSFGLIFSGYIKVDQNGIYTFYLGSDDGSQLFIDDKMIINNDGLHGINEVPGQVALKKGYHKIKVRYFEGLVDEGLRLKYQPPNGEKSEIEDKKFYHNLK